MKTTNPTNFRKWLDALRSGDYEQTTYVLARVRKLDDMPIKFCAVGVACEISGVSEWLFTYQYAIRAAGYDVTIPYPSPVRVNTFPTVVLEWLGLDSDHIVSVPMSENLRVPVTGLNDAWEMSFPQIADLLEAEYL